MARAAERAAALNVEFTRVRAPIGGRISRKFVSVGNLISGGQAGSTLLTTIVAIDPIQFVFDASESDYLKYNRKAVSGVCSDGFSTWTLPAARAGASFHTAIING